MQHEDLPILQKDQQWNRINLESDCLAFINIKINEKHKQTRQDQLKYSERTADNMYFAEAQDSQRTQPIWFSLVIVVQ